MGHICFADYTISVGVLSLVDGRRCRGLSTSLAGDHFNELGEREQYEEPVLAPKMTR